MFGCSTAFQAVQQLTVEASLQALLKLDVHILRGAIDQPVGPFGQLTHCQLVFLVSFWAHELTSIAMSRCDTVRCSA
jgi:hypothetical protein